MSSTQWPYEQSNYPNSRKPLGFWQDERTIAVLQQCIDEGRTPKAISVATSTLRVATGDVRYYTCLLGKYGTTTRASTITPV